MLGRLAALWMLAVALLRVLLRWLSGGRAGGLQRFRQHYGPEGLVPLSPSERAEVASFGRCVGCGLCDRGEGARIAGSGGRYQGVMQLMLAAGRTTLDRDAAARALHFIDDEALEAKEQRCPTRVPMRRIAAFVRSR